MHVSISKFDVHMNKKSLKLTTFEPKIKDYGTRNYRSNI